MTVAPHMQIGGGPPVPPLPDKYNNTFTDRKAPRTYNFNPDVPRYVELVRSSSNLADELIAVHHGSMGCQN